MKNTSTGNRISYGYRIAAVILLLATACTPKSDDAQPKTVAEPSQLFRTASIGEPSNLIAVLASDSASFDIVNKVYDTLLKLDGEREIVPSLAQSYTMSDDGLLFRFELHPKAQWHDGKPVTSEDVVHSFNILRDPRTPTSYASNYEKVAYVKAVSSYTVEVSYTEVFAPAIYSWVNFYVMPKHLIESAEDILNHPQNRAPVGSGPYTFKEWQAGSKIVLEANENYFDGPPKIKTYNYRIIPDLKTMFLELKSGNLDMMSLDPTQWKRQTGEQFKKKFAKYRWQGLSYTYLGFNLQRPLFQDKRVRQAINYAINRKDVIDGVLMGMGQASYGPYLPGMWYSNDAIKPYPNDPAKAKNLLKEAGWADSNGNGILDKEGKEFEFELITNQGNELRKQTAEIIQANLKDVGIKVSIRIIEWSAFLEKFVNARNFDALILGWGLGLDPDQYKMWHSSQTGETEFNFVSYSNAEVDQILELGRSSPKREERVRLYKRLQEILAEEVPYAWLYVPESLAAVNNKIGGIELKPAGIGYNFEDWYFKP